MLRYHRYIPDFLTYPIFALPDDAHRPFFLETLFLYFIDPMHENPEWNLFGLVTYNSSSLTPLVLWYYTSPDCESRASFRIVTSYKFLFSS